MEEYDKIAKEYCNIGPVEPIKTYVFIPSIKRLFGDLNEKRALDVGCGNGLYTRILKDLGAEEVVGVDSSQEMINLAIEEENKKPLGIRYLVQDIRNLTDLGDFDIVVAGLVLHYARTKEELRDEIDCVYRTLKKGGKFIAVIGRNLFSDYSKKYGFKVSGSEPLKEGDKVEVTLYKDNSNVSFHVYYWERSTYEEILEESGFIDIRWHRFEISEEGLEKYSDGYWNDFLEDSQYYLLECRK
ncbi:MAG: class I SAM-dependent methyltransferase [Nanoarchaeota archaeon]|nr:class I SAM-dependent methyltransferase [Nanoarchaeota archaeon]